MERDKLLHFIAGFLLSAIGGYIFLPFITLGFIAGYLKEWADVKWELGREELADMYWTWAGAMFGSMAVLSYLAFGGF